jgi:hypothetical protein
MLSDRRFAARGGDAFAGSIGLLFSLCDDANAYQIGSATGSPINGQP